MNRSSSHPPSTKLRAGDLYTDRFDVVALVGCGIAEVYRARDLERDEDVALKVLPRYCEPDVELRARLEKEAQVLRRVQHRSIVRLVDSGVAVSGESFLALEYLNGETLRSYLSRERCMPLDLALPLFRDLAEGLVAAHDANVVHRDLKPDNVFLTGPIGRPDGIRILDFGLALCEELGDEPRRVLGTLEYMAPEQVVADPADARSDVYAVGAVLFRTLTGELPFDTETGGPLLAHHLLSTAPPPSWLVDGLSEDVETIVLTSMRKHPRNRYPSMAALLDDLERVCSGQEALGAGYQVRPDIYVPKSPLGKQALEVLGKRHGHATWIPLREPESERPRSTPFPAQLTR